MTRRTIYRLLNLLGVVLALGAAVPTVARLLEPDHGTPIPQLAALQTWTLPVWLVAGLLLLPGRRPRSGAAVVVVLGLVIALGVRWQVPPSAARAVADDPAGIAVRVMTQNVEFGGADAPQVVALVRNHQVDVLVVEELTAAFVERARAAGLDTLLPNRDLHPQEGAAGTGIWSRWALQASGTLPSQGFEMPVTAITVPGRTGTLGVTGIHTQAPKADRVPLWRKDLAMIAATESARDKARGPQLYVGDFNASRDHTGFRAILGTGLVDAGDALPAAPWPGFTWPADETGPAFTRIDHVLLTPSTIGVRKLTVVTVAGTDHHGVVADLVVRPG